jgi:hypothetical protein
MSSYQIPWKCLDLTDSPKIIVNEPPKPQKTFAQALALTNLCDIPLSQFQQPVVKGDRLAIEIPEAAYEAGLEACKHNLHGRIIWPKGSTPLTVVALKAKLALIWKDLSRWGVISLGKGFFEFTFSSLEDVRRIRSIPSWNLNPGTLKFFAWTKDFNPRMQHNTSAQVWVKIFGLSQEYWHKNILFTIAGSLGTPICIDSVTAKPMHERTFGQFARVLIDIDLLQPLRYNLLVERKGFAFFVDLEYEHVPEFCNECKMIGHNIENCHRLMKEEDLRKIKENAAKHKAPVKKQVFVPINDGRVQKVQNTTNNVIVNVETDTIHVEDTARISPQLIVANPNNNDDGNSPRQQQQLAIQQREASTQQHEITTQQRKQLAGPILEPASPKSLMREHDKQLENELNDDDEDWSTDSKDSIVNDTQFGADAIVDNDDHVGEENNAIEGMNTPSPLVQNNGEAIKQVPSLPTPTRIAKDMAFLKESWANMVEDDENSSHNAADTTIHDDGFQIHLSKNHKKAQKK